MISNRDRSDDRSRHAATAEDTMLSKIGEIQTPLPAPEVVVIGLVVAIVATGTTLRRILAHAETVGVQVGTEPGDGPTVIAVGFRCLFNRLFVVVPVIVSVVVRMVFGGGSALTGRVGRHSTAGLAVVAAASLAFAQLDEGIGGSHPQLGREGGVVGGPVGEQGPWTWFRPGFLTGLWHTANITTNAALAPVSPARGRESAPAFPVSGQCSPDFRGR
jgi:hypothetical protein